MISLSLSLSLSLASYAARGPSTNDLAAPTASDPILLQSSTSIDAIKKPKVPLTPPSPKPEQQVSEAKLEIPVIISTRSSSPTVSPKRPYVLGCEEECNDFSPHRKADKSRNKRPVVHANLQDSDEEDFDEYGDYSGIGSRRESDPGRREPPSQGLGPRFFSFSQAHFPWRKQLPKHTKELSKSLDCLTEDSTRESEERSRPTSPGSLLSPPLARPIPAPRAVRQPAVMPVDFPRRPARTPAKRERKEPPAPLNAVTTVPSNEPDGSLAPPPSPAGAKPDHASPLESHGASHAKLKIRPGKAPLHFFKRSRSAEALDTLGRTSPKADADVTQPVESIKPLPGNKKEGAYEMVLNCHYDTGTFVG